MGFIMDPEEADRLLKKDNRNLKVLFRYLTGEDVNSNPEHAASRWVVNFFDWSLSRAQEYSDCYSRVEARVKPERMLLRDNSDGKRRKQFWWQYGRLTPALDKAIAEMPRVLVISRITNYVQFAFVDPNQVFADRLTVCAINDFGSFAALSSSFHYVWAWKYSVTNLSLLSYSSTDSFQSVKSFMRLEKVFIPFAVQP
jgi:hypothetical protein